MSAKIYTDRAQEIRFVKGFYLQENSNCTKYLYLTKICETLKRFPF